MSSTRSVLIGIAAIAVTAALAAPQPAAACEPDKVSLYLYESHLESGVLPPDVTIRVGRELSPWLADPALTSLVLNDFAYPQYDHPLGDYDIQYEDGPIFGVRNSSASTIYVLRSTDASETPGTSIAGVPAGQTVAYTIMPHTVVAFTDIPDPDFVHDLRELSEASVPADLKAQLSILAGGEVVTLQLTITATANPEVIEAQEREKECERMQGQSYPPPSLVDRMMSVVSSALAGIRLSRANSVALFVAIGLAGAVCVIGVAIIIRRGRSS